MINSRPTSNSLVAIGLFLIAMMVADIWLIIALVSDPSRYFLMKLILAPTLLVIVIVVAAKSYFSAINLSLGDNQLTYRYLLGSQKKHKISEVSDWQEEVVKRKNSEYRRLSIQLVNGKTLHLSNHENSNYEKLVNYLRKKVKVRK